MKKIKNLLQPVLFTLAFLFSIDNGFSQTISPRFFSQNAWMPDTIGNAGACQQAPCILYGSLHNKWSKIANSGAAMVRFGGIAADRNMPTNYQYIKMIDSIRAKGMEPIIQVPFHNWRYSATQAAAIVNYVNVVKGRNIKYWIIGNEPDHEYGYTTANQVSSYIKPFASAMKAVDPTILIVGPETAWYNTGIINGLTTPGGPDDITGTDANGRYYVDIVSFHQYAFDGSQSRAAMLSKLTQAGGYEANITLLNARIATCNSYHGRTGTIALKTAITEANVNYQNASTDNLNGTGVNSFVGGQFIGEMFGIGMKKNVDIINMWSVVEGNTNALNIGYIDGPTGNKKPAYHHFQLMADNFKGSYLASTSTQTNVKVFSCQNSATTTVMLMNMDLTNNFNYTVRLNTAAATGTNALKVNVNAGIAQEYNEVLSNQSTVLLFFNSSGALIKKIVYTLANHAALNLPPTVTNILPAVVQTSVTAPVNSTSSSNLVKCNGSTATLVAASGTNSINWFTSATSTVVAGTGSVFVTPALSASGTSATVSYYAQASNGSTVSARTPVSILVNPSPVVSVNNGTVCAGTAFVMAPSGAASYSFSNGSATVSPAVTSSYSVTGISAAGCVSGNTAVAVVNVATAPVISVNSGAVCSGDAFVMTPSGAASYTFSSGSATVYPTSNASYSVMGSYGPGCVSTVAAVANVTVNARPVVSVNSGTICPGSSFVMVPSGAASYSFSSGSATVSPSASTSYSVYGTSAAGCVSSNTAVASVNVSNSSAPVVSVNNGTICSGDVFTMIPSGASSYTFSSGSANVSPNATTSYTVFGSNGSGCAGTSSAVATVVVNERPVISAASGTICSGSSFIVPSGAATYTVLNAGFVVSPSSLSAYQIAGTSAQGCTSAANATAYVTVQSTPVLSVNSGTICKGTSFTMAPLGAANYTFSSGSPIVSPNATSSYTVTGANGNCVAQAVATITVLQKNANSKACTTGTTNVYVTPPAPAAPGTTVAVAGQDSSAIQLNEENVTDIASVDANAPMLSVYPNPSNGEFTIEVGEAGLYSLITIGGIVVRSAALDAGKIQVNITELPTGVYIVKIRRGQKVQFAKILKQ